MNSYPLDWLQIVNTALQILWRKGKSAPLREARRGGERQSLVESDTTRRPEWTGAPFMSFGNAIEGERIMLGLAELV